MWRWLLWLGGVIRDADSKVLFKSFLAESVEVIRLRKLLRAGHRKWKAGRRSAAVAHAKKQEAIRGWTEEKRRGRMDRAEHQAERERLTVQIRELEGEVNILRKSAEVHAAEIVRFQAMIERDTEIAAIAGRATREQAKRGVLPEAQR